MRTVLGLSQKEKRLNSAPSSHARRSIEHHRLDVFATQVVVPLLTCCHRQSIRGLNVEQSFNSEHCSFR